MSEKRKPGLEALRAEQEQQIDLELQKFLPELGKLKTIFFDDMYGGRTEEAKIQWLVILTAIANFAIKLHKKNLLLNLHTLTSSDSQSLVNPDETYKYLTKIVGEIAIFLGIEDLDGVSFLLQYTSQQLVPYINFDQKTFESWRTSPFFQIAVFLN